MKYGPNKRFKWFWIDFLVQSITFALISYCWSELWATSSATLITENYINNKLKSYHWYQLTITHQQKNTKNVPKETLQESATQNFFIYKPRCFGQYIECWSMSVVCSFYFKAKVNNQLHLLSANSVLILRQENLQSCFKSSQVLLRNTTR